MTVKTPTLQNWEQFWNGVRLPTEVNPKLWFDGYALLRRYLPRAPRRLVEVGCAPGRMLAFFARHFGYEVCGIDYAPEAIEATRRNLELLGIPAEVLCQNFFEYSEREGFFDVVYSLGFIEHFDDTAGVVGRLVRLAKPEEGYVVTEVPNLHGFGGHVVHLMSPEWFACHVRITLEQLVQVHEEHGVRTLFADYCGPPSVGLLVQHTNFARRHPRAAGILNVPFRAVNCALRNASKWSGRVPRWRLLSPGILYIGRRDGRRD